MRPPGGRLVIAGGNGKSSAPGSATGGVVNGAAPVDKDKQNIRYLANTIIFLHSYRRLI